jgi:ATP-dependent DNA helicase DinG
LSDAAGAVEAILGPGGSLARALPGYELRADQLELARAVARALAERHYLVAEAGTGTGKTLAYLVPAALSGRKVVVSTATKALQEQIWLRDLPLLRDRCGLEVRAAALKGRANYWCLERGERFARNPTFASREEGAHWSRLAAWARSTTTGDRSEVDLPDQYAAWREVSATGETCLGRECERYEECFVTQARARAQEADVVVVNHHLFFADLAMRTSRAGVEVLPAYDAVIFDEAHALEEVATEYFGLSVSSWRIEELVRDAAAAARDRPDLAASLKQRTQALARAGDGFFGPLAEAVRRGGAAHSRPSTSLALRARYARGERRGGPSERAPGERRGARGERAGVEDVRAELTPEILEPLQAEQERLDEALEEVRGMLADAEAPSLLAIARRAAELRTELEAVTAMAEPSRVFFAEARGRGLFLRAAPVDVSEELVERLYRRLDTAVFTSATLAAQGSFAFFRGQVGLADFDVLEARLPGPFDYQRQAALVVPEGMPEPAAPDFPAAAAGAVQELCAVTGGRAFVLCTSNRMMRALRDLCSGLPYRLLLQGERPKHLLLEDFRAEPSVLFATQSFWEGVDVPGEALSLVVIDKLPFAPPGDPVVAARLRAVEARGGDGFAELSVPQAALALRQGFGRLIRTRTDRGIVAVLDPRLLTRGYGRAFLATLPPVPLCRSIEEARRWWAGSGATSP